MTNIAIGAEQVRHFERSLGGNPTGSGYRGVEGGASQGYHRRLASPPLAFLGARLAHSDPRRTVHAGHEPPDVRAEDQARFETNPRGAYRPHLGVDDAGHEKRKSCGSIAPPTPPISSRGNATQRA
jgi:hypothetical protein